jgi:hypothetical protein
MQNTGIQNLNHLALVPYNEIRAIENFDNEVSSFRPSQLKSWMINMYFKCPVTGVCLLLEEQKKILKKAGYSIKKLDPYKTHQIMVESLEDENNISTRIDAYLNRKYHREISEYLYLDESAFLKEWKIHFESGLIEGLLWVAATRSDFSPGSISSIFGDIHMQMHLNSEQSRKDRQHLAYQMEENLKLSQTLKEVNRIKRYIKKEKERVEKAFTKLHSADLILGKEKREIEVELRELREDSSVETLQAENCRLQAKVEELSEAIKDYKQKLKSLKDQDNKLFLKLERQRQINSDLRKEADRVTNQISTSHPSDDKGPSFDLHNKRILIVGGITKITSFYRELVEENGGIFEYHDGYMNGGVNGLENKVRRSDLVLCPVNCNSHNACSMVKRFSKKYEKTVYMLTNSGLSTISQSLIKSRGGTEWHMNK